MIRDIYRSFKHITNILVGWRGKYISDTSCYILVQAKRVTCCEPNAAAPRLVRVPRLSQKKYVFWLHIFVELRVAGVESFGTTACVHSVEYDHSTWGEQSTYRCNAMLPIRSPIKKGFHQQHRNLDTCNIMMTTYLRRRQMRAPSLESQRFLAKSGCSIFIGASRSIPKPPGSY